MARNTTLDMTEGTPIKLLVKFSIPLILGNLLQQCYNLADSIVVGNFSADGVAALEAVNNAFPPCHFFASFFIGLSMGATVVTARAFGRKNVTEIQQIGSTVYGLIIPLGVFVGTLSLLLTPWLMNLMSVTDTAWTYTRQYMIVAFAGVIGVIGFNLNSGIMQGLGDTKTPLLLLAITSVLNIILDLIFVIVFHLDTLGVALATVISQFLSWVFGMIYINRKYKGMLHLNPFHFKEMKRSIFKDIMALGIPSALYQAAVSIGSMLVMRVVNAAGIGSGFGCSHKIDTFCILPMTSISNGFMAYVGQNCGAGRTDRLKQGLKHGAILILISYFIVAPVTTIFAEPLISIFTDDLSVIADGAAILRIFMPFYFLLGFMFLFSGALRGIGKPFAPFIATFVFLTVGRYFFTLFLYKTFGDINPVYMIFSFPITWVFSCCTLFPILMLGKWRKLTRASPPEPQGRLE